MRQNKTFFTIIELLVIVAVLAALMALLQPALQRTVWGAKHSVCMNNLKQTYQAFFLYYEDHNIKKPWDFSNGTFDGPDEALQNTRNGNPGNPAKVLVNEEYALSPQNLFCPLSPLNAEEHFHKDARDHARRTGRPSFWASYSYLYRSDRKGVMIADLQEAVWKIYESNYRIAYDAPFRYHYNLLNEDGTVFFLTDIDREFLNYIPGPMVGK